MNHEAAILPYIVAVLSAVFTILLAVLAWVGAQVYKRLDHLTDAVTRTNDTLGRIDRDLRADLNELSGEIYDRLNGLDRRLVMVEGTCHMQHGRPQGAD
jgi:hypothetical protein